MYDKSVRQLMSLPIFIYMLHFVCLAVCGSDIAQPPYF